MEVPQQDSVSLISLVLVTITGEGRRFKPTSLQLLGFPMAELSHRKIMLLFKEPESQYAWFG